MAFIKGKSGNPNGRPAVTAVSEIRKALALRNIDLIEEALECLGQIEDPERKLYNIFKLMDFLYSKPKEIEITPEQAAEVLKDAIRMAAASGQSGSIEKPTAQLQSE